MQKSIAEIKALSKEEFMKLPGASEDLYNNLQRAKAGWIQMSRQFDGAGDRGMTDAFGEGLSCKVYNWSSWWQTSVIQSIDWENHTFKTMNSTYDFQFKTLEELEKEKMEFDKQVMEDLKKYESPSN